MKGISSKHIVLKADAIGAKKKILFAGASVHFPARKSLQAGAVEGLKAANLVVCLCVTSFER